MTYWSFITRLGQKHCFNFAIINVTHLDSNIATVLAYGAYISQLLRYDRPSRLYSPSLSCHRLLSTKRSSQGLFNIFSSYLSKKILGRYRHFVEKYPSIFGQLTIDGIDI